MTFIVQYNYIFTLYNIGFFQKLVIGSFVQLLHFLYTIINSS